MSAVEKQNRPERDGERQRREEGFADEASLTAVRLSGRSRGETVEYRRTPWYTKLTILMLVVIVAAAVLHAYREPLMARLNPPPPPVVITKPPAVTVTPATTGAITEHAVVTGNLVAREEILVSPQIEGYAVDKIMVEEGDRVSEGQVLAELSTTTIDTSLAQNEAQTARAEAAIAQAESAIAEAKANQDQTASAYARSKALVRTGNTTAEQLDQREAAAKMADARAASAEHALTVARADKKLADAQRSELMVRLEHTKVRAPAAGVISRRAARIGAIASASGDPLFRIIRDGDIELEADVPEATLARIRPGMTAEVTTAGSKEPFVARVRLVSPEVNSVTRLGRVRIAIDQAPGLTIGAFGRASVAVANHTGVLVPQSAVLYTEDGATVQIVHDGVVATTPVKLGLRTEKQAEVVEGVKAGDKVIATAGTFVRDGDKVSAVDGAGLAQPATETK
ncbi:efflux RND transporter periplasmic adaptor subunit [Labrys neptuniae]|uniref:Efflux RND transporter periplasmic adaptor subunit n=1 Tax=Labrys neptuniae TaxID=376174 RepID=A0ABV3PLE4_9HYPH